MSIPADIQSLSQSAIVDMFVLDTGAVGGGLSYFHSGTNQLQQPVVWQGVTYQILPIEAEGFEVTAKGQLPRPKVRVANVGSGMVSAAVHDLEDLVGCTLIRKRTFAKYLDAVNFPGGNPTADPSQHFPDESWYIERKTNEDRYVIEWELSSAFDLMGVMLPHRQVVQNSCAWRYRSPECGWTGGDFDRNDLPCNPGDDFCGKRLASCKARYGDQILPFGGFPGSVRYG